MKRIIGAALAAGFLISAPARADEVEDALNAALEAYRAGDVKVAKEELDYASTLLQQMKAEGLEAFLPEPLDGWERLETETNAAPAAMFGGGLMAMAEYTDGSDDVMVQMMADNQMVAMMGAMLANPAMMGQMGKVERINRQMVVVGNDGQVQTLINNRILIQISGSASNDVKLAYMKAIDFDGLKDF
jgi:hypothetical protein